MPSTQEGRENGLSPCGDGLGGALFAFIVMFLKPGALKRGQIRIGSSLERSQLVVF